MATAARIGMGSTFQVSTDSGSTYTTIAEVTSITPPSDNIDIIDATSMDSTNYTREFIVGLNDPGTCSLEMNFIPGSAGDVKLIQIRDARVAVYCKITFPNAVVWTFQAILTGYEPQIPTDDKMSATVSFKVTGSYTVS